MASSTPVGVNEPLSKHQKSNSIKIKSLAKWEEMRGLFEVTASDELDEMRLKIRANGGYATMYPTSTNFAVVCDRQIYKVNVLMQRKKHNFVYWQWLERCLEHGKCFPFRDQDMIQAKPGFRLEDQKEEEEDEEEDEKKAEEHNCCWCQPGGCPIYQEAIRELEQINTEVAALDAQLTAKRAAVRE